MDENYSKNIYMSMILEILDNKTINNIGKFKNSSKANPNVLNAHATGNPILILLSSWGLLFFTRRF